MKKIIALLLISVSLLSQGVFAQSLQQGAQDAMSSMQLSTDPRLNQGADLMKAKDTDLSLRILTTILGGDIRKPGADGGTISGIGEAMLILNVIMMAFGASIFAGTAMSGILRTGNDGELLGKQWNSTWVAIRFGLGAMLLMPTVSGFSVAQVMGLGGISLGVGSANSIWSASAKASFEKQGAIVGMVSSQNTEVKSMMRAIFLNEVCTDAHQKEADRQFKAVSGNAGGENPVKWGMKEIPGADGKPGEIHWGMTSGHYLNNPDANYLNPTNPDFYMSGVILDSSSTADTDCGSVSLPLISSSSQDAALGIVGGAGIQSALGSRVASAATGLAAAPIFVVDSIGTIASAAADSMSGIGQAARQAQIDGVTKSAAALRELAKQMTPGYIVDADGNAKINPQWRPVPQELVDATIDKAASDYTSSVANAVTSALRADDRGQNFESKMIQDATTNGWINAGIWFYQIAKVNSEIARYTSWLPSVATGKLTGENGPDPSVIKPAKNAIDQSGDTSWMKKLGEIREPKGLMAMIGEYLFNLIGVDKTGLAHYMATNLGFNPNDYRHPILQLQASGTHMIAVSGIVYLGSISMEAAEKSAEDSLFGTAAKAVGFSGAGVFVQKAAAILSTLSLALLAMGITEAYVLPLIPFIKWVKQVLLFMITCCEVMVAIPLWIAFHMTPEGEGFAGDRVQQGYGILLEAALRPVVLVFGFLFAYALMWPMLIWFHGVFFATIATMNSQNLWDIIVAFIVQGAIYVMMCYFIVEKCCDVIDVLPGTVMRWVNIHAAPQHSDAESKIHGGIGVMKSEGRTAMGAAAGAGAEERLSGKGDRLNNMPSTNKASDGSRGGI